MFGKRAVAGIFIAAFEGCLNVTGKVISAFLLYDDNALQTQRGTKEIDVKVLQRSMEEFC